MTLMHQTVAAFLAAATLTAQCPPPVGVVPPTPPPPVWGGPGDVALPGTPIPSGPVASAPTAVRPATVVVAPRPQALRYVPEHIARALRRYGAPLELVHEHTALACLTYDWTYAKVIKPPADGITVAQYRSRALPLADAVAAIAEGDRRPFLILRECYRCGSDDESEIGRKLGNEKTILLAKWFRCVRVSDAVRHDDHPLHAVFAGPQAPHLVLGTATGEITPIESGRPLSSLWATMRSHITQAYEGDPDGSVGELLQLLSQFDHLDNLEAELAGQLDRALQANASSARDVKVLRQRLATLAEERIALEDREQKALALRLRPEAKKPEAKKS